MTYEGVVCTLGTLIGINVPSGYKTIAISEKFYKLLNSYKFKFANLRRLRLCINFICKFYFPQQKNPLKFSKNPMFFSPFSERNRIFDHNQRQNRKLWQLIITVVHRMEVWIR